MHFFQILKKASFIYCSKNTTIINYINGKQADISPNYKNEQNSLHLRSCCNGWIYSVGASIRKLDFGLTITSVTFHPQTNKANPKNLNHQLHVTAN